MTGFRFPISRSKKADLDPGAFFEDAAEKEEPGIINGIQAKSILEWRVAKALWKYNVDFRYQHALLGGTHKRGGLVLDFLILEGRPYALEVQGERWHKGQFGSNENRRIAIIESILETKVQFVWEPDLQTQESADAAVRRVI